VLDGKNLLKAGHNMCTLTKNWRLALAAIGLAVALASLTNCSRKSSGTPGLTSQSTADAGHGRWALHVMNQPGNVFHVEYSDKTVVVDRQTVSQSLRGYSEDHTIFIFQDSPTLRQKLAPKQIVLFEGLDLRRVDALAVDGDKLVVGTEPAPLREALKNAEMRWSVPVDFKEISDQRAAELRRLQAPPSKFALWNSVSHWWSAREQKVYASSSGELEGEKEIEDTDFATWKIKYHHIFNNSDHSLDIDLQLHREAPGMNAEIAAKGHMTKFTQTSSILMADGEFKQATFKNVGLHGNVNFHWELSTSESKTSMNEVRLKLPGKISVPLDFTGLPMSLQVSEALLFHPAFPTKGDVAQGGFHVDYSGDEGFKLSGTDMQTDGEAGSESAIDKTVAFSPLAAYGVVVAMAVPRVELRIGTEEIFEALEIPQSVYLKAGKLLQNSPLTGTWLPKAGNPLSTEAAAYFRVVISTTASHSGMQSLVPCQQFTMTAKGQVGVDSKVLGVDMNSPAKDIFTKNIVQRQPDAKICGGGQNESPQ
jgi:hypothetical protein